jgi:exodeoxyribonuclease VII large subunit
MESAIRGLAALKRARLSEVAGKMDVLSPLATLRRGYALPQGADGKILRSVGAFEEGDRFALRVSDGSVPCEVQGGS